MLGRDMAVAAGRLRDRESKLTTTWKAEVRRKKTNIEKLRAADAMRAIVAREATASGASSGAGGAAGAAPGRTGTGMTMRGPRVFSPYVPSPGSGWQERMGSEGGTSGYAGPDRNGLGVREYDVELGTWQDDHSQQELFHAR